jgi:chromosome segregation protein
MHIKKLEISGFKSFVDRTVVHFDHDVTGVVGPNGCGKSNIVDAIRWCMGEQSPRQLRGKSMDDVIFAGSESRKPNGFAEVTITFSNDNAEYAQTLPIEYRDYPEIAVARRLFRDGTSEYLINKTQVRLKDVNDLFLGTGVGSKAYSIIEQGKIGLIVSAKPEDRRLLIEEAAGITKYKHRKKQAEKKMDLTRQNLLRVGDIVAEIERNLSSLKRQAAKAKRYLSYREEHDDLVLHEASHRLLAFIAVEKVERAQAEESKETAERERTELASRQASLDAGRAESVELERLVDKDQNAAFLADNEVRTCEAKSQRATDRLHVLEERQLSATEEGKRVRTEAERLQKEHSAIHASLENLEGQEAEHEERLRIEESKLLAREAEHRDVDARAGWLRKTVAQSSATAAAAEERLAGYDHRVEDMRLRKERLTIDTERFREDLREVEDRRSSVAEQVASLEQDQASTNERVAVLSSQMQRYREGMVDSDRTLEQAKNDLSQSRGRLRALEEVHARLEGVGKGPRALVDTHDPCILGLVADLVEAPGDLIGPFAALMGERLQTVVVDDLDRAAVLLSDLAGKKVGRASVIHVAPPFVASPQRRQVMGPGVVGPLAARLRFDPQHEALVQALAGDALLVEDHAVAIRLRAEGIRRNIVTLAGTVYHADGRISGGTGDAVAAGLLQQKIQLREMRSTADEHQQRVESLLTRHGELRESLTEVGDLLEEARTNEREVQLEKLTLDNELRRADDQITTVSSRLEEIARESDELEGKLDETALERDEAERTLVKAKAEAEGAAEELERAEQETRVWAERVSEQKEVCTDRKIEFARIREQANSGRATQERLERSIDELTGRADSLEREVLESAVEQGRLAAELFELKARMLDASLDAQKAHLEFERRRQALDNARNALAVHEAEIKVLRDRLEAVAERHRTHEMALQKIEIDREHLLEAIAEKFRGLKLPSVMGDYHLRPPPDEEHRNRIEQLAELIDRMGPVNLDAMEEYEKTSERYTFYTTQKADLDKALSDLERAIQQMNRESRRLFKVTFDAVNERFQAIFPRMFRGGKATLVLTNPEDLLETGVEIKAQPPGKKVSSIELLSGGEKALTAVSLIFAIFQHRPSPFCVLDEVDAPLDEANVTRFNDLVRSMTDRSQFILITHIKRTMQSVDVLYGVTMQEPGVSRLVSVKVNPAAQPRWVAGETEAVA